MDLLTFIRDIPDFPKPGIIFKDITPLLNNPEAFKASIEQLASRYAGTRIDKIVGIEARGFIFAGALAYRLGTGMVPVRKKGKLPYKTLSETYELEYGTDTMEIHEDAIKPGDHVLVLDDLIATGGTLAATCRLVEKLGGSIVEVAILIELSFLNGREKVKKYPYFTLLTV